MYQEAFSWTGLNNSADQKFVLTLGGRYHFAAQGTFNSNTVKLQTLGPDGTNYLDIFGAYDVSAAEQNEPINTLSAAGVLVLDLPPGSYKIVCGGSGMTIAAGVTRVPLV